MSNIEAAIERLESGYYNSDRVTEDNPGGMGDGGHVTNFPASLKDTGDVGRGCTDALADTQAARDAAEEHKTAAITAREGAEAALDELDGEVSQAQAARDKAAQWADNDEDAPVEAGPDRFSAKHWAQKAMALVSQLPFVNLKGLSEAGAGKFLRTSGENALEALTTGQMAALMLKGTLRSAVGGTADAPTVSTGLDLSSLPAGLRLRVRFAETNTGAMTINVDGIGAVTAKTPLLNDPPAGYIRTGFDHVIEYDGTRWIVFRLVQNIVNANGRAVLLEDGTMIATHRVTTSLSVDNAYGNIFRSGGASATFPAEFAAVPNVAVTEGGSDSGWVNVYNVSTTGVAFRSLDGISRATAEVTYAYTAIGRWF